MSACSEDEFDSFGKTVALALRGMPREQMIHARKLINDVIYEGQLNNLSRESAVKPSNQQNAASIYAYPNSLSTEVYRSYQYQ